MKRLSDWMSRQMKAKVNPLWKLFLTGLKGQIQIKYAKPYGYYIRIISLLATIGYGYYFLQFRKFEMDSKGCNVLIPNYIYKVREENHIYWQTVRNAQDLPSMFTFYKWDENLMFQIDRQGNQKPFQTHRGLQNNKTFSSPLHEYNFPASPQTHNRILLYLKNIKNPYDLQNYLRAKPVNMGDWLRALYYGVYRETGFSNRWRYDEYVSKPNLYYRWQKLKFAYLMSRDREYLFETLDKILPSLDSDDVVTFLCWFL